MKKWVGKLKIALSLSILAGVVAVMGNACSEFASVETDGASIYGNDYYKRNQPDQNNYTDDELEDIIPGAYTIGLPYGDQVLSNMKVASDLSESEISNQTRAVEAERIGSFSTFGYMGDATSSMMMGITALAIEVCDDLVEKESRYPAGLNGGRVIFNSVNFAGTSISDTEFDDLTNRLALTYLGAPRTAYPEERLVIREEIGGMIGPVNNRQRAVSACAAMIASLDGVRL